VRKLLYPQTLIRLVSVYSINPSLCSTVFLFFFCGAATQRWSWPPHSWGFYITHNDAPQSVRLLWTSDQLVAETYTPQRTTLTTDKTGGIRTHDLSRRAAADLRLRPRGHLCSTVTGTVNWINLCSSNNHKPINEHYAEFRFMYTLKAGILFFSDIFRRGLRPWWRNIEYLTTI
jgi:hypothetical protein